jgi:hypothetical protein
MMLQTSYFRMVSFVKKKLKLVKDLLKNIPYSYSLLILYEWIGKQFNAS